MKLLEKKEIIGSTASRDICESRLADKPTGWPRGPRASRLRFSVVSLSHALPYALYYEELSWGIARKSSPILTEINDRKSQSHEFSPNPKVSGFPWREQGVVRLGLNQQDQKVG